MWIMGELQSEAALAGSRSDGYRAEITEVIGVPALTHIKGGHHERIETG